MSWWRWKRFPRREPTRLARTRTSRDFQENLKLVSGVTAAHFTPFVIGTEDNAQRVFGQVVSANFFAVLGCAAGSRQVVLSGRGPRFTRLFSHRRDQLPALAEPVPRQSRCDRQTGARQRPSAHHRGSGGAFVPRHHGRVNAGCLGTAEYDSGDGRPEHVGGGGSQCPLPGCLRTPKTGSEPAAGARRIEPDCGAHRPAVPGNPRARDGHHGSLVEDAGGRARAAAEPVAHFGRGLLPGAADCLRQCRQPASGARCFTATRVQHSHGHGRHPVAVDSSTADRSPITFGRRRLVRSLAFAMGG